jgi:hypothetical protein
MPSPLRSTLSALASTFTDAVLATIRGASLDDLHAESGGWVSSARGARRAPSDGGGSQPAPVAKRGKTALAKRKLRAKGQKRATTYTVA